MNEKNVHMWCVKLLLVFVFFLFSGNLSAQKINGQWRGYFNTNGDIVLSSGDNTEYVLEIEINGSKITGYSYSYFQNRRYYVICSLSGTYYKSTNSMKVTETARVKGLTPPDWNDCLQTHILTYQKEGNSEELKGRWVTAPGQVGECGVGLTTLSRKTITRDLSSYNKSKSGTPFSSRQAVPKKQEPIVRNNSKRPVNPPVVKNAPGTKPRTVPPPVVKSDPVEKAVPDIITPEKRPAAPPLMAPNFEKRGTNLVKTIEIVNPTFKIDLYDNGDIDGDSVSLFYNGRLLLSHKKLTDKPLSVTLQSNEDDESNELTMYAENLGSIPPNTALMIVTDGDKRYEVRIASDLKKSGTIRFIHKPRLQ